MMVKCDRCCAEVDTALSLRAGVVVTVVLCVACAQEQLQHFLNVYLNDQARAAWGDGMRASGAVLNRTPHEGRPLPPVVAAKLAGLVPDEAKV